MEIKTDIPDFFEIGNKLINDAHRFAEVHCLNHFKESFHKQGFTDSSYAPWNERTEPDYRPGGAILTSSGFLRDSLDVLSSQKFRIEFGSYASYAKIHNEGGTITIPVTAKMKKYFWFMFKKTENEKWKWMAISKKPFMKIKVEKRQFIGESVIMMNGLDQWFLSEVIKRFKQIK